MTAATGLRDGRSSLREPAPVTGRVVSEHGMASFDGVNFYVKPDGMTFAEFWEALRPKSPPQDS